MDTFSQLLAASFVNYSFFLSVIKMALMTQAKGMGLTIKLLYILQVLLEF